MADMKQTELKACLESAGFKTFCLLGKACGGKASVFLAKKKDTLLTARICPFEENKEALQCLYNEVRFLRCQVRHPNVISLLDCFSIQDTLVMTQPLLDMGSVTDVIHGGFLTGLPEMAIVYICYELLKAIDYLHSIDIIHRGIRGSHVLLGSQGMGQVVLTGFRHSISMMRGGCRSSRVFDFTEHCQPNLLWMAPEVLQQNVQGYTTRSDVYSLGVTVCEMGNGFAPFEDMERMQMLFEKLRGTTPSLLDCTTCPPESGTDHAKRRFSENIHDFSRATLVTDPTNRPSARDLMTHAFFKQLKKNKHSLRQLLVPTLPICEKNVKTEPVVPVRTQKTVEIDWDFD